MTPREAHEPPTDAELAAIRRAVEEASQHWNPVMSFRFSARVDHRNRAAWWLEAQHVGALALVLAAYDAVVRERDAEQRRAFAAELRERILRERAEAAERERDETKRKMASAMAEMAANASRAYQGLSERASAAEALAETRGRAATALLREKETLAARVAAVEGALRRHGKHDEICAAMGEAVAECSCGFEAAERTALGGGKGTR